MRTFKYLSFIFLASLLAISCKSGYKFKLTTPNKTTLGKQISVSLEETNGNAIDSVQFYVNGKKVASKGTNASINTGDFGVGKQVVTALVFYPEHTKKVNNTVEVFANKAPERYSYKIVNEYPHDSTAYTQGLEFYNGYLYETTGRKGTSWLRKIDYKTGKVLQQKDLSNRYFGEGMTVFNNKIYWLTWQAGKGFVFNSDTFEQEGEFAYGNSKEGWGLTHNETELIKSDGSNRIWFLNPENLNETRSIQVYTNDRSLDKLNELDYINGKIYSNWWRTSGKKASRSTIVIINPKSGAVEGVVGLNDLREKVLKNQSLDVDEVLNGIAYNPTTKTFFVTGKHWDKLFEIEIFKK